MVIVNYTKKEIVCIHQGKRILIPIGSEANISPCYQGDMLEIHHTCKSGYFIKFKLLEFLDYFPVIDLISALFKRPYMNISVNSSYIVNDCKERKIYVYNDKYDFSSEAYYDYFILNDETLLSPACYFCPDADEMKDKEKKSESLIDKLFVVSIAFLIFVISNILYKPSLQDFFVFQIIPAVIFALCLGCWKFISIITKKGSEAKFSRISQYFCSEYIYTVIINRKNNNL